MDVIEKEIKRFLDRKVPPDEEPHDNQQATSVHFYYRNQYSAQYKQEEKNLKKILTDNIQPRNNHIIKISIYYRNRKLSNILIKNNINKEKIESHVVYSYTCEMEECRLSKYIGYTTTTLKQRMTTHAQNGSITTHNKEKHNRKLKAAEILEHIKPIHHSIDKIELQIAEALFIKEEKPSLNNQREGETRILQIF